MPYTRILGYSEKGKKLISAIKAKNPKINLVTSVKEFMDNSKNKVLKEMLAIDIYATNVYTLGYEKDSWSNLDYTSKIVTSTDLKEVKNKMILGITGSSGAGKSTVCEILERKYSSQTINADKIAKQLSKQGTNYLQEIIQNFGDDILLEDGELNRRKLANIIYSNPEKRDELNNITFKYIKNEIKEQIAKSNNNIIAIDAPLLFRGEFTRDM